MEWGAPLHSAPLRGPGRNTRTSRTRWAVDVAGGLNMDLQQTVVAADGRHVSSIAAQLHEDARIRFRERVQIGRPDEREGFWPGPLWADRHDRPLLRHRAELGCRRHTRRTRASINESHYPADTFGAVSDAESIVPAPARRNAEPRNGDGLIG